MNREDLKQKLKGAWYMQRALNNELDKLQELRSLAQKVTPSYSQVPGCGSSGRHKLENSVAKIVEQEKIVAEHCDRLCGQLNEVRALIELLPMGPMRLIMQYRYLNCQKWELIATKLGYSWRGIHKLHSKALEVILQKSA